MESQQQINPLQDVVTPLSLESDAICECMSVISFNMHGHNQGSHTVRDLMSSMKPDVLLLQEHCSTYSYETI